MRRRSVATGLTLVLAAGALCAGWAWRVWTGPPQPAGTTATPHLIRIRPGTTLAAAADTLVARGLLADRRILLVGARLSGRARALQAGLYELSPGLAPRDLLDRLTSGGSVRLRLTLPEGLDAAETADLVAQTLGGDGETFLAAADSLVRSRALAAGLFAGADDLARYEDLLAAGSGDLSRRLRLCEGYLAPDTYIFAAGTGPRAVAAHLVETQLARIDSACRRGGDAAPGSGHALLTLASIVESEARRADERTRIAAVYANRLAAGWRLEADPTVAYVLGKKGARLFYRDLEVVSAWNTYRVAGLPPGPIGSPGLASLLAAAVPDPECRAFFFVSDGEDGHVFSRTAAEHEAAVRRFRAIRGADRRRQDH